MRIGDQAPDFELPVQRGETFRLRDARGKKNVVLYFYPADFTLGCTSEACSFQERLPQIQQADTVVVGISPDHIVMHERFARAMKLEFLLASDPEKRVIRLYGALWWWGVRVKRITVVIDKRGVVRGVIHHELLWGRHSADVVSLLQTLS
jgi:peroxiredoxin Q/BCP